MAFNEQPSNPAPSEPEAPSTVEAIEEAGASTAPPQQLLDTARRAMALKQYETASEQLADVLELLSDTYDEHHEVLAPILHLYGRALLESAIANSGALGGGGTKDAPMPTKAKASGSGYAAGGSGSASGSSSAKINDPRFSFSGDAESEDEEDDDGAPEAGTAGGEDDDDDLGIAFSVLEVARVIYRRALESDKKRITTLEGQTWNELRIKSELAEVLNDLGDVGLESENFQQASSDYQACLELLTPLLQPHSRRLADAHLRLGLALEFHPTVSEREGAIRHVTAASNVLAARLAALEERQKTIASLPASESEAQRMLKNVNEVRREKVADDEDKGKGKCKETPAEGEKVEKDDILSMSSDQVELELQDIKGLKEGLDTKLAEYESPLGLAKLAGQSEVGGVETSTKEALEQAIKEAFLGGDGKAEVDGGKGKWEGKVNDLSGMVKRKKKGREGEEEEGSEAKKVRVESKQE